MRPFLSVFVAAFQSFLEDKAPRLGAALAYYTVFSIPPLLVVLIAIAGMVFGRDAVQTRIVETIERLVGPAGALAIEEMMRSSHRTNRGVVATGIGLTTLLIGASGVFGQLKDALDTLWEVEPRGGRGIGAWLKKYVFSMLLLLGTGFLLIVSLGVSAALSALGDYFARTLPGGEGLWQTVNFGVSLGVIAVMFAMMFRFIPDGVVAWRDALIGGIVTSVLFTAGEAAIGIYLGRTNVGSAFGASGSLVVMLVWVYYAANIFLYGAEFTKCYATRLGQRIVPSPYAAPVTEEAREQQGIPHRTPPATAG